MENKYISEVAEKLISACNPEKILIVSKKVGFDGELNSFKLCLIVADDVPSISELEQKLYIDIDSKIPYDLILYRSKEWEKFKNQTGAFAWKVNNTGVVIYG